MSGGHRQKHTHTAPQPHIIHHTKKKDNMTSQINTLILLMNKYNIPDHSFLSLSEDERFGYLLPVVGIQNKEDLLFLVNYKPNALTCCKPTKDQKNTYSLRETKKKNIVYFNSQFTFGAQYKNTTWIKQKISMLLFTNGRRFSKPSIDMVYESNAMQIIHEHSDVKFVLYFDGKQVFVTDCFSDVMIKNAIRRTGVTSDQKIRSDVRRCIKEHLEDTSLVNILNKSSVINVWKLSDFTRITKIIKKYTTYFANVQKHFSSKIHERSLEDDVLDVVYKDFAKHNPTINKDDIKMSKQVGYGEKLYNIPMNCSTSCMELKVDYLTRAFQSVAYLENILVTNGSIDLLQAMHSSLKKAYKPHSSTVNQSSTYRNEEVIGQQYPQHSDSWLLEQIRERKDFGFEGNIHNRHQKTRGTAKFLKQMNNGFSPKKKPDQSDHILDSLRPLWSYRDHMNYNGRTFKDFVEFLLTNNDAKVWIHYLVSAYAMDYNSSTEIKLRSAKPKHAPPELCGKVANSVIELVLFPLLFRTTGSKQLYLMTLVLPALLSSWFSVRPGVIFDTCVISERDWNCRMKLYEDTNLKKLICGLFFIVTRNGYRIHKLEHKNFETYRKKLSRNDQDPLKKARLDLDLKTTEQLSKYSRLLECLPIIHKAYEMIHGKVSHETSTTRYYCSNQFIAHGVHRNKFYVLKNHQFPFLHRKKYKYGNKCYIGPDLTGIDTGGVILMGTSTPSILSNVKVQFQNDDVAKYIQKERVKIFTKGSEHEEVPLRFIPHTLEGREEFYTPFYKKNKTPTLLIEKSFKQINDIWKSIVRTGKATFHYHGQSHQLALNIREKKSHLRLCASKSIVFRHLGRYVTGVFLKNIQDYLQMSIWDGNVTTTINGMMTKLKINESHVSNEVINKYNCFRKTTYDDYTRLDNHVDQMAKRMASHPQIKPSWESRPDTFVHPTVSKNDFLTRCHDMRQLSITEQNCQLFYLSKVWECYKIINNLLTIHRGHAGLLREKSKLETVMASAQEIWRTENKKRRNSHTNKKQRKKKDKRR